MTNKLFPFLFFCLITIVFSCKKDSPNIPDIKPRISLDSNCVFIVNEGNFQFGNASVSLYNSTTKYIQEDIYKPANNKGLGDIAQSICFYNSNMYIVVNNSSKIEVVDETTYKSIATISGLTSPRYMLPVSTNKAYVTDLYANKIAIVDLSTNSISGYINCNGWTEKMVQIGQEVYVSNMMSDNVYVIDANTDKLIDSIKTGYASNSLVLDKNKNLWVLCGGSYSKKSNASLYCINTVNKTIIKSFVFNLSTDNPTKLTINNGMDSLYYLNGGVYVMRIDHATLPTQAFITKGNSNYYGLGIDPYTSNIYISDAKDYVQRGSVYCYNTKAELINSFLAGIIPGEFYFKLNN